MNREEITAAATQYIEAERDESFATEVRELLGAQRWDELDDRFYTDLVGQWDKDGDTRFGEYMDDRGPGGVSLASPE